MVNYIDEIEALFDKYEEKKLTESQIYERCCILVKDHNFDRDYMYDLNDTLNYRGYTFQFKVPSLKKKEFNKQEYLELMRNVTRSKNNTKELIQYLVDVDDYRLSLASLYVLKVGYLIDLGLLPKDNPEINKYQKENIKELIYNHLYQRDDIYDILVETLFKLGIKYANLDYMKFRLDMEFLLYSIEKNNPSNGYLKVNTIKVAYNITPKIYYEWNLKKKIYYTLDISKYIKDYLKLIDPKLKRLVKDTWIKDIDLIEENGYKVLLKLL